MKKLSIRFSILIVVAFAFIVASCNKEQLNEDLNQPEDAVPVAVDKAVNLANQKYLVAEVFGGDQNLTFFIPNEGLIDEYLATETITPDPGKALGNAFIGCLRALELSDAQKPMVRRSLLAYENRNQLLIAKHRQEVAKILNRAEDLRKELRRQLMAGEITQAEFDRRILLLRVKVQTELLRLKESNAADFSRSYRLLMHQLHNILTPAQWNTFTLCLQ